MRKTFVGIGFGPIQSGLFVYEAYRSGKFDRLVVAEVADDVVDAVRRVKGTYAVNLAGNTGVDVQEVKGIEILNPRIPSDQQRLIAAIAESDEIATALPSVDSFDRGSPSPALLLANGLLQRAKRNDSRRTLVYAAENDNHAAEKLCQSVLARFPKVVRPWLDEHVQFVNTVIGKMSGVVDDPAEIAEAGLHPMVRGGATAVLVEQFNRILIQQVRLPEYSRGIDVFVEKTQLLPFEEAKLYGHNAAHALLGYLAHRKGLALMSETAQEPLLEMVKEAFLNESGKPLCRKHGGIDPLFTESGWHAYVMDLLERMTNSYLRDKVDRVIRDPMRKLGWNDRLIGTIRLGFQYGVRPSLYLKGAAAAVNLVVGCAETERARQTLYHCWSNSAAPRQERERIAALVLDELANLDDAASICH